MAHAPLIPYRGGPSAVRAESNRITRDRFSVDLDRSTLIAGGLRVLLTARQAELMRVLLDAAYIGQVATYDHILARVYGPVEADQPEGGIHVIKVHCCLLRKRLLGSGLRIVTHRGRSYELAPEI